MRILKCVGLFIIVLSSGFAFSQDATQLPDKVLKDAKNGKYGGGYQSIKWGMNKGEVVTILQEKSAEEDKRIYGTGSINGDDEDYENAKKGEVFEKKDGDTVIQVSFYNNALYRVRLYLSKDVFGTRDKDKIEATIKSLNSKYGKAVIKRKKVPVNVNNEWQGTTDEVTYVWFDKFTRISTVTKISTIYSTQPGHSNYSKPVIQYYLPNIHYESQIIENYKKQEEAKLKQTKETDTITNKI